jgi:hypothetical protein
MRARQRLQLAGRHIAASTPPPRKASQDQQLTSKFAARHRQRRLHSSRLASALRHGRRFVVRRRLRQVLCINIDWLCAARPGHRRHAWAEHHRHGDQSVP